MRSLLLLSACAGLTACASPDKPAPVASVDVPPIEVTEFPADTVRRVGLVFDISNAPGQPPLRGPVRDGANVLAMMERAGLDAKRYSESLATRETFTAAVTGAARQLRAGDLLVIYYSGHGDQGRDTDGDEGDGLDERLCLWDAPFTDDEFANLTYAMPAGLRVVFWADTCHAGTLYRLPAPFLAREPDYRPALKVALIYYGGTPDGDVSIDLSEGGVMTLAMLRTGPAGQTWRSWVPAAQLASPRDYGQTFAYDEFGPVADGFRNGPAMR